MLFHRNDPSIRFTNTLSVSLFLVRLIFICFSARLSTFYRTLDGMGIYCLHSSSTPSLSHSCSGRKTDPKSNGKKSNENGKEARSRETFKRKITVLNLILSRSLPFSIPIMEHGRGERRSKEKGFRLFSFCVSVVTFKGEHFISLLNQIQLAHSKLLQFGVNRSCFPHSVPMYQPFSHFTTLCLANDAVIFVAAAAFAKLHLRCVFGTVLCTSASASQPCTK